MTERSVILVTGATGNVGRHVVPGLLAAGAAVRAVTRDPDTAGLPGGAESCAPAMLDVIARQARRVVYLSATAVHDDREPQENGIWGQVEQLIERSGLAWTFLRASGFAANTLVWADQIRDEGLVRWPYGGAARSLIHERDIADVAVRALTEHGHAGAR